jgi:hypothetical protein
MHAKIKLELTRILADKNGVCAMEMIKKIRYLVYNKQEAQALNRFLNYFLFTCARYCIVSQTSLYSVPEASNSSDIYGEKAKVVVILD